MENTISYCQEPTRIERIFVERLLEHVVAKGSFEGMTNKTSHDFTWPLKHEGLLSLPSICNTNSLITKENRNTSTSLESLNLISTSYIFQTTQLQRPGSWGSLALKLNQTGVKHKLKHPNKLSDANKF